MMIITLRICNHTGLGLKFILSVFSGKTPSWGNKYQWSQVISIPCIQLNNKSLPRGKWPRIRPRRIPTDSVQFSSVQSLSHVRLFATPWIAAHQASLSITNSQSSLRLMSIESVMLSSYLILCCPLLLLPPIPPSIRVFSNESTLHMRWPGYWSFSFSISPSKEIPGLISFRMDWLDLFAVQGTLKSLLQHHSSKTSILQCSAFFNIQLSHPYDHRKNHSLD